ncbi:hypothetical protein CF645_37800 [Burkholderia pseudomallei]|nr:hypothetical protein CF645_37800 [Burkholderia pseudomallei]
MYNRQRTRDGRRVIEMPYVRALRGGARADLRAAECLVRAAARGLHLAPAHACAGARCSPRAAARTRHSAARRSARAPPRSARTYGISMTRRPSRVRCLLYTTDGRDPGGD